MGSDLLMNEYFMECIDIIYVVYLKCYIKLRCLSRQMVLRCNYTAT